MVIIIIIEQYHQQCFAFSVFLPPLHIHPFILTSLYFSLASRALSRWENREPGVWQLLQVHTVAILLSLCQVLCIKWFTYIIPLNVCNNFIE